MLERLITQVLLPSYTGDSDFTQRYTGAMTRIVPYEGTTSYVGPSGGQLDSNLAGQPKLHIMQANTWKNVKELFVHQAGQWKKV